MLFITVTNDKGLCHDCTLISFISSTGLHTDTVAHGAYVCMYVYEDDVDDDDDQDKDEDENGVVIVVVVAIVIVIIIIATKSPSQSNQLAINIKPINISYLSCLRRMHFDSTKNHQIKYIQPTRTTTSVRRI